MSPVSMLEGPLVWDTTIAKNLEHFTLVLSASDCAEIHDALAAFKGKSSHREDGVEQEPILTMLIK